MTSDIYLRRYMPNEPLQQQDSEDYRINMHDSWQVLWWCRFFGVTKTELEMAIRAAGNHVDDVRQYLKTHH